MSRTPLRVAVIGAGVVGCLVVHGLQQQDDIEIFCIDRGPEENVLAGTGLNVGPNALKVLQQQDPELATALQAAGISLPWRSWVAGLTDGTVILDLPLSHVADNPGIRIRWSDLYRQLRSRIAARVRYKTTLLELGYAESSEAGPLYLVVEDQETGDRQRIDRVDLVLGCDGRYSQVRQTFFGAPEPKQFGVCIYRLLVPASGDLIEDYQQWFHNGHRLLAFAIPGDEIYIAGSFPLGEALEIPDAAKTPEFLWNCYRPPAGYSKACHFLASAVCEHIDQIHWARIQEIPLAFGDDRGHVLCLGDSSHAMFPTLGQGATQAFEDGCVFVAEMRRWLAAGRSGGVSSLVARVESERRDRVEFVQSFSRDASKSLLAGSDAAIDLREKTQPPFLQRLDRLYRQTPIVV
ncbi:FAD-dependent monooxygenase [Leptolyngbya sp. FACHB-36]|uniref:FAD-dependent oxidoreductase n=1 Tax=Leptolyngbya sp. FACHB-36 TaxID=2692808 RepID=UPI001680F048|nr:NAD(P)/FAD-dependent oxidoreductase [Leptolyngbya sp. FACHB-36]MBD2020472.1 FAD-dependent monooxygenase [Leptolyngbya sp. FACHB-36]